MKVWTLTHPVYGETAQWLDSNPHGSVDRLVLWLKPCGKRKEVPDAVRKPKLNFFWKNWSLRRRLSELRWRRSFTPIGSWLIGQIKVPPCRDENPQNSTGLEVAHSHGLCCVVSWLIPNLHQVEN